MRSLFYKRERTVSSLFPYGKKLVLIGTGLIFLERDILSYG